MKLDNDDKLDDLQGKLNDLYGSGDDLGFVQGCANALAIILFFAFFGWVAFGAFFGGDWFK